MSHAMFWPEATGPVKIQPSLVRSAGIPLLLAFILGFTALQSLAQTVEPADGSRTAQDVADVEVNAHQGWQRQHRHWQGRRDNGVVSIGHDARLPLGEKANAVVAVLGSSTVEGEVEDGVVSVMGSSRVTGRVGDSVVAVMGNVYVNNTVGRDVVAVMGDVELGPDAEVNGNVVVVGGELKRASTAVIHGAVDRVATGFMPRLGGLSVWFKRCLMYGRPLAFEPGLGWAWALAFGFLAFYMLLALMFGQPLERCIQTLETQPGRSTVVSLLAFVLTPVAFVVLCFTVIGVFLIPFFWMGLMIAGWFGKAAVLAALGKRLTRHLGSGPQAHTAVAVFMGGLLVMALYLVPVLGFIVFKLLSMLGLGVVINTWMLAEKARKAERRAAQPSGAAPTAAGTTPDTKGNVSFAASSVGAAGAEPIERDIESGELSGASVSAAASGQPASAIPPRPSDASTLPRASFWIRMGALLIDLIIIGVLMKLVSRSDDMEGVTLILLATYGALMWKLRGTTIGGIVCGLQVVRADGRPVDWATAIVRALGCFLSLGVMGLGFFWIAFDDEKQGWHDKIAGTLVVRAPRGASLV